MLRLNKKGKIVDVLDRLEDYTNDKKFIPDYNIQNIIAVLMDIGDMFPTGDTGLLMGFNTSMRILRITNQLINRFDQKNRHDILKYAIENSERSIYTIVHEISVQDQEHGKYDLKGQNLGDVDPEEYRTVNPQQLDNLETLATKKIHVWVNNGELDKNEHFIEILYSWENWEGKSKVKSYIDSLIEHDDGLINFITGFTKELSSYTLSGQLIERHWDINLDSMKDFVNLNEIKLRIDKVRYSKKFERLSPKNKIAVEKFLEKM